MKFIIRDDDLNFFSTPADIERWYGDIFAQHIPVGFATIPFVKPISDVYTAHVPKEDKEYSISGNQELISYVRAQPHIEVIQHGTTHETKGGIFEYARTVPLDETKRGREELERAFGVQVNLFAPPHDWIGRSGIFAVEAAGQDIIRGRGAGLRNLIVRPRYALNFVRMLFFKLWHVLRGRVPAYPYILNFGKHKELCSYRLEDTDVFEGLRYAHQKDGVFVVVTHVHYYTPEKKERLLKLIGEAQKLGAEFVKPSTVFS